MKKIMNNVDDIVLEMCHGLILANSELLLDEKYKIIYKKHLKKDKVALVSGGGSGHEPAHGGFVGNGMLDAAICGDIFASPSQVQIYQGIKRVASDKGVLLLVKNYSGDIMNFKNAMYLAQEDGIKIDYVKIDDDIAVEDSLYTVGKRGVAGTIFIEKIVGAAAETGYSLKELKKLAETAIERTKTIGFALSSCTVPSKGSPTFDLGNDEIEFGVGIHGEPGIERMSLKSSKELASEMLERLVEQLPIRSKDNKVALMINGFGGTPLMELYILNHDAAEILNQMEVNVQHTFVGNYMTSIDMQGASITLLLLNDQLEEFLTLPVSMLGFHSKNKGEISSASFYSLKKAPLKKGVYQLETKKCNGKIDEVITLENMIFIIDVMADVIIRNEQKFCELDSYAGDGDFGMSVAKGFRSLKDQWQELLEEEDLSIAKFLNDVSLIIMENCGGASGPIWGSAFRAASKDTQGKQTLTISDMGSMLQATVQGVQETGKRSFGRGAKVGDKTLIDALAPCADKWMNISEQKGSWQEAFDQGAKSAIMGAEQTKGFAAKMGRAGTVGKRSVGYPDAGAFALGVIFTEISKNLTFS
ncbi:dihydroxyacetone kinase subunit DhaK [Enterococcus sp. OL5]|uniref:dihydroxyacetone kinase subunit DhaK n=1 Tax=Enterococcus sp. OL5 TaxID=2590214 RepID=UPI00112ED11D|nr:dihydroxyacetone kinase subunit DhaK [Enterococcus sp. OL5]TPR58434.1 dihydroxyacetone kinase subunit DhaK [Enterococcus sp. OL5]